MSWHHLVQVSSPDLAQPKQCTKSCVPCALLRFEDAKSNSRCIGLQPLQKRIIQVPCSQRVLSSPQEPAHVIMNVQDEHITKLNTVAVSIAMCKA